jgi:hypothetical protein
MRDNPNERGIGEIATGAGVCTTTTGSTGSIGTASGKGSGTGRGSGAGAGIIGVSLPSKRGGVLGVSEGPDPEELVTGTGSGATGTGIVCSVGASSILSCAHTGRIGPKSSEKIKRNDKTEEDLVKYFIEKYSTRIYCKNLQ